MWSEIEGSLKIQGYIDIENITLVVALIGSRNKEETLKWRGLKLLGPL